MRNTMTLDEAKSVIDAIAGRDTSSLSKSEKRAKVLNKILDHYAILSNQDSYNTGYEFSLDDIGYLLGTSKQYVKNIEIKTMNKLSTLLKEQNLHK